MTALNLNCGRIDWHEPHTWRGHGCWGGYRHPARTYHCHGGPLIEGSGYWTAWDAEDDAADEHAAQQRRDAS